MYSIIAVPSRYPRTASNPRRSGVPERLGITALGLGLGDTCCFVTVILVIAVVVPNYALFCFILVTCDDLR